MFLHGDDVSDVSLVLSRVMSFGKKDHKAKRHCHHIILSRVHTINMTCSVDVNLDHPAEKVKSNFKTF